MAHTHTHKSSEKNILTAFLLNLFFSLFELFGGLWSGSTAILSDSLHDLGDAISIGVSWLCEKKSRRKPDETYTYGYTRYSLIGSVFTTLILLCGSLLVILRAVGRILSPQEIRYDSMIVFAVIGFLVNFAAARLTHGGESLNQKAVNLHMLEDVLGWAIVLLGAIVMRFTDFDLLDPLLSIGVSIYILFHAAKTLRETLGLFLEKAPHGMNTTAVRDTLLSLEGVAEVHHIHLWSMDAGRHFATMHIVTALPPEDVKAKVRKALAKLGISHATLEIEHPDEICTAVHCPAGEEHTEYCHHHH